MGGTTRSAGLRTIFSFFLGLMLTAFFGIGAYTFHPPPDQFDQRIRELNRRERDIRGASSSAGLTAEDRDQIEEIRLERGELRDAAEEARKPWCLRTSIILIVFSTLLLAVSLIRADQLGVVSSGLLLGGVLTMLYGIGWIAFTGTSVLRFLVMTAALVVTLVLGYVRFVRQGKGTPPLDAEATPMGPALEAIERRVQDLEERIHVAARALGDTRDE